MGRRVFLGIAHGVVVLVIVLAHLLIPFVVALHVKAFDFAFHYTLNLGPIEVDQCLKCTIVPLPWLVLLQP